MNKPYTAMKSGPSPRKQTGMSMVEVLVAIVVVSLGLLGLAGMQATGLKNNFSAHSRAQAMQYAQDMLDRMRTNRVAALAGNYDLALAAAAPACAGAISCDQADWMADVATLPAGDASIVTAGGLTTITVQWDDSRAGGAGAVGNIILETEL
jgi:type IV pilus assembly protein PilV